MCISMVGNKYLVIYFIYFFIRFHKVSSRYALIVAGRILLMHFVATLRDSITKVF
jgi:hypothetical protein